MKARHKEQKENFKPVILELETREELDFILDLLCGKYLESDPHNFYMNFRKALGKFK